MREIKFRGKSPNGKGEWVYGFYTQGGFYNPNTGESIVRHIIDSDMLYDIDPDTLGQYTGLHDKNGKEIYEGDIINSTDYPFMDDGETNYLGIVSCDTSDAIGEFFVMLFVTKDSERRGISNFTNKSFYEMEMRNVEVVGNIFDNKGMFRDSDEEIMEWYLSD